jgi:PleD family two-component response regulator
MNLSTPILICDKNEEIRLLIKNMLSRYGYFHLLEAHSTEEIFQILNENQFLIVGKNLMSEKMKKVLSERKKFLIISPTREEETINLSAFFGVKHLISFPYSSKILIEKINDLMN